jgi:hypothetical protein
MNYVWQSPGKQTERQPIVRIDYNLTDKHRLSGVYNWQVVIRDPDHLNSDDVRFPGLTNFARYESYRPLASGTLRSALSSNLVNELRGGIRWGPGYFGMDSSSGGATFAGSNNYAIDFTDDDLNLTNWHQQNGMNWRSAWSWNIDNTLNWQARDAQPQLRRLPLLWQRVSGLQQVVPGITFAMATEDPRRACSAPRIFRRVNRRAGRCTRPLRAFDRTRQLVHGQAMLGEDSNRCEYLGFERAPER